MGAPMLFEDRHPSAMEAALCTAANSTWTCFSPPDKWPGGPCPPAPPSSDSSSCASLLLAEPGNGYEGESQLVSQGGASHHITPPPPPPPASLAAVAIRLRR